MSNYSKIQSSADIDVFIEKTNAIHDGYIVAVDFRNKGIKVVDYGYEFNPELTQLKISILITSIFDAVLEIVFDNIIEWKIKDSQLEILEATVFFDEKGFIIWTDDETNKNDFKTNDCYVIAQKMKWRFI